MFTQVTSTRQARVRDELDVLVRCRQEYDEPVREDEVTILSVGMMGLVAMWGSPDEVARMVPFQWTRPRESTYERLATEIYSHVQTKGDRFFSYVNSPEKLAEALMNLERFPGAKPGGAGPGSSSRWEFASVILRDLGRSDLALKAMNAGMEWTRERVESGEAFPEALEFAERLFECYRPWLSPH